MEVEQYQETIKRVKNVYANCKKNANPELHTVLETLQNRFLEYLEAIKESENFPYYINGSKKQDARFLLYYGVAKNIANGNFTLPAEVHETNFDYRQFGCPLSSQDPHLVPWLLFIRSAVQLLKEHNPQFTADAWVGVEVIDVEDQALTDDLYSTQPLQSPREARQDNLGPEDDLALEVELPDPGADDEREKLRQKPTKKLQFAAIHSLDPRCPSPERRLEPKNLTSVFYEYRNPSPVKHPRRVLPEMDATLVANFEFNDWQYPEKLETLITSIRTMHAYGRKIDREDAAKGKIAMLLAVDLFREAKNHFELDDEEQADDKQLFIQRFTKKLHLHDDVMSEHRKYWKVIVANIAAALTVVGLLVISVNLFATGQLLFSTPKSVRNIAAVEEEFDKSMSVVTI